MTDYRVELKQLQSAQVACLRRVVPNYPAVRELIDELADSLDGRPGVLGAIWHDPGYKETEIDAEAVVYLPSPVLAGIDSAVRTLPGGPVATTIHRGAYNTLHAAYQALHTWIGLNGYQVVGPVRELYLHRPTPVRQDDDSAVTEIQIPVRK